MLEPIKKEVNMGPLKKNLLKNLNVMLKLIPDAMHKLNPYAKTTQPVCKVKEDHVATSVSTQINLVPQS